MSDDTEETKPAPKRGRKATPEVAPEVHPDLPEECPERGTLVRISPDIAFYVKK